MIRQPQRHVSNPGYNMAHFLVDADSVIFRAGCSVEDRYYLVLDADGGIVTRCQKKKDAEAVLPVGGSIARHKEFKDGNDEEKARIIAIGRLKEVMNNVILHKECTSYEVWIGGTGNFRKDLYPEYKANRDAFARPMLEEVLRGYLIKKYNAQLADGQEAEDVVSYRSLMMSDTIIAHIDKDLDNTPGGHFNYVTGENYTLTQEEADINFFRQALTGDSTDNIPGIAGCGPVKAAAVISEHTGFDDMWNKVVAYYVQCGYSADDALLNARLVWIRRAPMEMFGAAVDGPRYWK